MARLSAGQIVIVDWRDGLPNEPNKRRPAVVVEDTDLFSADFPNVIVVPLTEHSDFAIAQLSVVIDPTEANQCPSRCYALSHAITTISKRRIMQTTTSHITGEQLRTIRLQCAESIGL